MVRITLTTAFVASLALSAFATPVARESSLVKVPMKKLHASSVKAIANKDVARYSNLKSNKGGSSGAGSGTVINEVDSYIAEVQVGSQTFDLIVDTGSSNLWVGAGTKFSKGSTGKSTGDSFQVSYGSGSVTGTEYTDTASFGGVTVTNQGVGVAKSAQGFTGVDGIIGFGPVDLTEDTVSGEDTVPTFMDNLYSQGTISTEVLGVYFAPESGSDQDDANGELTLGGTDSSKYSGSITYTPVLTSGDYAPYWGIKVSSISYSGTSLGSTSAIVDTGTTLILLSQSVYSKFLSASGGKSDDETGLTKFSKKPTGSLTFTIGGAQLTLTPTDYLISSAQASAQGLSGTYAWISTGGSSGVDTIIGQKFLESFYSVFDTTNGRVGFAPRT